MKRLLVVLILLGTTVVATAAFDHSGWRWKRTIPLRDTSGFVRIPIMPEILDQSQVTLNDLRVLDSNNNLVPHVIHWGRVRDERHMQWLPARLLNAAFIRALLEGSNDSVTWEVLAEDRWLFNVSLQGRNFNVDTLKFPHNNFRYLRLTVYNMTDDPRRITIESVKAAFYQAESKKELVEVPVKRLNISHDAKKNQSIFELDLGFRNLPVVIMECEIATPFFYRGYELLGRNQAMEKVRHKKESGWQTVERKVPWTTVRKGVLYRTRYKQKTSASLILDDLKAPYRYLQLRVFNGDNPPLQLSRAKLFRRETSLVFQAQTQQAYYLIGGNTKVRPPDYDLAKAIAGVDEFSLPVVHSGPEVLLIATKEKQLPWSERHSGLILMILGAAVGLMLAFIIKNLKRLPRKEGPH
jgi:hypothetical protein